MKILFYDAKKYDIESFRKEALKYPEISIEYLETDLNPTTATLAKGYDAVCGFVSSDLGTEVINVLADEGITLLLMRCAGFNNIDLKKAKERNMIYATQLFTEFS